MDKSNIITARREAIRTIGTTGLGVLGAFGLADASAKKQKGKKNKKKGSRGSTFATRFEFSGFSDQLPVAAGGVVNAFADCGSAGKVVSCGYQINAAASSLLSTAVNGVSPVEDLSGCVASLVRTTDVDASAGAEIQAIAICLE
jgi:hypothetical protein